MGLLDSILPKYNYTYFDAYNQIQVKQLNIFQCILRKAFGYYAETHLSNVVKKAYTVTLSGQFQQGPEKRQALLKLIAKAYAVLSINQSDTKIAEFKLDADTKVSIGARYALSRPKKPTDDLKISSIDLTLIFSRCNRTLARHTLSIFKNNSQKLVVHLPNLFQGRSDDSKEMIESRLKGEYAKTITDFLAKTLNDSSTAHEITDLRYYSTDHRWMYQSLNRDPSKNAQDSETLNGIQDKALNQLGWGYFTQFTKEGYYGPQDMKRIYLLRKEAAAQNQTLTSLGFNQTLSIAFAASSLEAQDREY
jgi:hypothetical protein